MCTTDARDIDSDLCSGSNAAEFFKRSGKELMILSSEDSTSISLEKRGARIEKILTNSRFSNIYIIPAYTSIGGSWTIAQTSKILRKAFRMRKGYCAGSVLDVTDLPTLPSNAQYKGLEIEHPLDKGLQEPFLDCASTGMLSDGRPSTLQKIAEAFWKEKWNTGNAKLAAIGPVGSDKGKRPAKPNERFAEVFGSTSNSAPFIAVEKGVNIDKGKIFKLENPVDLGVIDKLAAAAAKADTDKAANKLLSELQTVSDISNYSDYYLRSFFRRMVRVQHINRYFRHSLRSSTFVTTGSRLASTLWWRTDTFN
jgi:hypothetical protein